MFGECDFCVRDRETTLDFRRDLVAVQLAVLGVELAMHICDLAHEERVDRVAASRARGSGNRAAAAATRAATSRSASSSHATPTATSSSELTSWAVNSGAIASRSAAQSVTLRAIGPTWSKLGASGKQPAVETRAKVGLKPTTPQHAAGMRIEPPESVPSASFGEARCQRRSRTAGGAAGDPAGCERIRDCAEVCVLRRDPVGELVQVRLADVRIAGRFGKEDGCRSRGRVVLREDRRAVRRRQACSVEQILDREPRPLADSGGGRKEDAAGRHQADLTGYLRRFGFGGFFTGAIATRRVELAP